MKLWAFLNDFKSRTVFARMYANDRPTSVEAKYYKGEETLRNLRDFPPYVRMGEGKTSVSEDGVDYDIVDDSYVSEELQIYRLLDPTFILPAVLFKTQKDILLPSEWMYKVEKLPLPKSVKEYFHQEGEISRWVRVGFRYRPFGPLLFSMSQKDFPPFRDTITMVFEEQLSS